jgi:hypothetical protein
MQTPTSNLSDAELEQLIAMACELIKTAPDFEAQSTAARTMSSLIAMRSPKRIAEMERQQGLR